jgi:hypothetical protein
VLSRIFRKITRELSGISCQVSGPARRIISDSVATKKLAGFYMKNLVQLLQNTSLIEKRQSKKVKECWLKNIFHDINGVFLKQNV